MQDLLCFYVVWMQVSSSSLDCIPTESFSSHVLPFSLVISRESIQQQPCKISPYLSYFTFQVQVQASRMSSLKFWNLSDTSLQFCYTCGADFEVCHDYLYSFIPIVAYLFSQHKNGKYRCTSGKHPCIYFLNLRWLTYVFSQEMVVRSGMRMLC